MSLFLRKFSITILVLTLTAACDEEPLLVSERHQYGMSAAAVGGPNDHDAIAQIIATFDQNWGVDPIAYAAQYAGADFVGPFGELLDDAGIVQLYTNIFPAFAQTTRQSIIRRLTFLTGTIAVLDLDVRVTGALPPFVTPWQGNTVRALEKHILQKRGGEWQIIQHQQLLVAPGLP